MSASIRALVGIATLALFAVAVATPAAAETATNLKCKGCVGKKDLGKQAVRGKHIKENAVASTHILDGGVAPADLAATAKPAGGDGTAGDQSIALTSTAQVVRSVVVAAPVAGFAVVTATGSTVAVGSGLAACSLSLDTAVDPAHQIVAGHTGAALNSYIPFALTRLFPVPQGNTTVRLVCRESSGTSVVEDSAMSAIFVPNRY